jgi:myo-inositol catabolism protein IolC
VGLGYDKQLYMLAFHHRASFSKNLFGVEGLPTPAQLEQIAEAKLVIHEAFERALADVVDSQTAGLLVDELYCAEVARRAHAAGRALAIPVEKSGQEEFDFEYGEHSAEIAENYRRMIGAYTAVTSHR